MIYVTDAHALLWHLFLPQRLGKAANQAFQASDSGSATICVPAVAIAEMIMVTSKGRLPGATIVELLNHLQRIQTMTNFTLLPLLPETVITSHTLAAIPDIFDRLIVADAQRLNAPLLTRDTTIQATGLVATVWD
jgi:PIN domain nuclease of toxin-antitoxin system